MKTFIWRFKQAWCHLKGMHTMVITRVTNVPNNTIDVSVKCRNCKWTGLIILTRYSIENPFTEKTPTPVSGPDAGASVGGVTDQNIQTN